MSVSVPTTDLEGGGTKMGSSSSVQNSQQRPFNPTAPQSPADWWPRPQPPTGNEFSDSYARALYEAQLANRDRYGIIRGGDSEGDAAFGGYVGAFLNNQNQFIGAEKDLEQQFAQTEGILKNRELSSGLTNTTREATEVGLIAEQRQRAMNDLTRRRAASQQKSHLDLLNFMERREDSDPNLDFAAQAARMAGAGGASLGGFGRGGGGRPDIYQQYAGLQSRRPTSTPSYRYQGTRPGWNRPGAHRSLRTLRPYSSRNKPQNLNTTVAHTGGYYGPQLASRNPMGRGFVGPSTFKAGLAPWMREKGFRSSGQRAERAKEAEQRRIAINNRQGPGVA